MVKIDMDKCIKCELCVKSCPTDAIKPLEGIVNNDRCMSCSHCVSVCPTDAVTQDGLLGEVLVPHNITSEDFENLLYERKSIRNFKKGPIDENTLNDFQALMRYAPTGTNSQATYISVLNNEDKIKDLSTQTITYFQKTLKTMVTPFTIPLLKLFLGKKKSDKLISYKKFILNLEEGKDIITYNCPAVVVFHASPESSSPDQDCNIQSSYASLHAVTLGLGTCFNGFITRAINGNKQIKNSLNIPKKNKVYSTLLVGYPELNYKKRVIRDELKVELIS